MDRRHFIKISSALGIAVHFGSTSISLCAPNATTLPRHASSTGTLTTLEKDRLWSIFTAIGENWGSAKTCFLKRKAFDEIIDLKTTREPSYLWEYQNAIQTIAGQIKNQDLSLVLSGFLKNQSDENTRAFVVVELIELQLAHGGFRALGYENYRGFMGGPFSSPNHLPYRVMEPR